jgi:hypothetical protein
MKEDLVSRTLKALMQVMSKVLDEILRLRIGTMRFDTSKPDEAAMNDPDLRFWPYKPRLTLAATVAVLVGLLLATAALRALAKWPSPQSETVVLIGVLLLSLLPIALALLDVIIDRGGIIKYGGVEIDFARSKEKGAPGITVASNIGVPGLPVTDSATMQIRLVAASHC